MRRHDWSSRMYSVIDECIHKTFAYGGHDCCLFVAYVVDAMTDSNFLSELTSSYHDKASAEDLIAKYIDLRGAVSHYLGDPVDERPRRGDVVLFDGGEGDSVGIWSGADIVGVGATGLHRVKSRDFKAVWHV